MKTLLISGSNHPQSTNLVLLNHIEQKLSAQSVYFDIDQLPAFRPNLETDQLPKQVLDWKQSVENCQAVVITSPEYLHNIPATLKSALEWLATDSFMQGKKVLPIIFTPMAPRGEKALQSLLFTLQALKMNVLTSLLLHHNDFEQFPAKELQGEGTDLLKEALQMIESA